MKKKSTRLLSSIISLQLIKEVEKQIHALTLAKR
jgi:hypothetical protein